MPLFSAPGEAYQFDSGHEIVLLAGVTVKVAHFRLIHSRVMFVRAYDEIIITSIKLQHEPPRVVGDLLSAAIAKNQAHLIMYQLTVAKLRWPRTSTTSTSPARPSARRSCATSRRLRHRPAQRRLHRRHRHGQVALAIAITRTPIRSGARGWFHNVLDLADRLETERRSGKQGRTADYLNLLDVVVLPDLGVSKRICQIADNIDGDREMGRRLEKKDNRRTRVSSTAAGRGGA